MNSKEQESSASCPSLCSECAMPEHEMSNVLHGLTTIEGYELGRKLGYFSGLLGSPAEATVAVKRTHLPHVLDLCRKSNRQFALGGNPIADLMPEWEHVRLLEKPSVYYKLTGYASVCPPDRSRTADTSQAEVSRSLRDRTGQRGRQYLARLLQRWSLCLHTPTLLASCKIPGQYSFASPNDPIQLVTVSNDSKSQNG